MSWAQSLFGQRQLHDPFTNRTLWRSIQFELNKRTPFTDSIIPFMRIAFTTCEAGQYQRFLIQPKNTTGPENRSWFLRLCEKIRCTTICAVSEFIPWSTCKKRLCRNDFLNLKMVNKKWKRAYLAWTASCNSWNESFAFHNRLGRLIPHHPAVGSLTVTYYAGVGLGLSLVNFLILSNPLLHSKSQ